MPEARPERNSPANRLAERWLWMWSGLALAAPLSALVLVLHLLDPTEAAQVGAVPVVVGLMIAGGAIYLLVIHRLGKAALDRRAAAWVFVIGLALRLSFFGSDPYLEDDHYRYLWDGAVLAAGHDPYRWSPLEIREAQPGRVPEELHRLAADSGPVIKAVNHPWLRTIYPPLAEGAFALAHLVKPFSLNAWRVVLLAFDLAALTLLYLILKRLALPLAGLAVYWWNPVLIQQAYNAGHMDLVALPFALAALLFTLDRRPVRSALFLGLAACAKLWPVVLLPAALRLFLDQPRRLALALALFGAVTAAGLWPFLAGGLDRGSGLGAYGRIWQMNDSAFMLVLWAARGFLGLLNTTAATPQAAARAAVVLAAMGFAIWVSRRRAGSPVETAGRFLPAVAAVFLLSPTQFPWYYLWLLPFLAVSPRFSLLLPTALLPLYYLRFFLNSKGLVSLFDHGLVWVEFVPVWVLLAVEWRRSRAGSAVGGGG